MSALNGTDNRNTADRPVPAGALAERIDEPSVYLTDEVFLYRVVGLAANGVGQMVELEDCYRLDVVRVPVRDLRARRLRVVTPAPVQR
jgi:hypothetical protein